uniref:Ferritin n=1 Tax=Staphylothermus marinus TaxID=2280 RepID=A0A7J3KG93_STAMA
MSQRVVEALSNQLNQELRNAYLYLVIASYFDSMGLRGFANFFKIQAKEELGHAMKIYDYIHETGGQPIFSNITLPEIRISNPREAIEIFYRSEVENSERIYKLVDLAREVGDKALESFLKWFIDEQVEEVSLARNILDKIKLIGDNTAALLVLDSQLAERK